MAYRSFESKDRFLAQTFGDPKACVSTVKLSQKKIFQKLYKADSVSAVKLSQKKNISDSLYGIVNLTVCQKSI